MADKTTSDFTELKNDIRAVVKEHSANGGWDGTLYNGTTILVIMLTSFSALISVGSPYEVHDKILSGIAAILVTNAYALGMTMLPAIFYGPLAFHPVEPHP